MKYITIYLVLLLNSHCCELFCQDRSIQILSLASDSAFTQDKSIVYHGSKADSIIALINNSNTSYIITSINTINVQVELSSHKYYVLFISENYCRLFLDSFSNEFIDWSRCLLLYQMNAISGDFFEKDDFKNQNLWRKVRKKLDFKRHDRWCK
jgi:hypothetical protein